jgi:hypothetical protein
MSTGLEELETTVGNLATDDAELTAAVEAAAEGFARVEAEIEALKNSGGVPESALDPLTSAVSAAGSSVAEAVAKLHAATPPAPAEPVAPVEPEPAPAEPAPVEPPAEPAAG